MNETDILLLIILFFLYLPGQSYLEDHSDIAVKMQGYSKFYISCDK